jgi:glycosyltransferase involved in cell wall biosynthesis
MLVVFATHNGASRFLNVMLDSMRLLRAPSDGLRIIAVDSASTDGTRAVLEGAADLPLTTLAVDEPGKNHALNAALDHVQDKLVLHSLVVFTDDDICAAPSWLVELEKAALAAPDADIFGGRIDPAFPHEPDPPLLGLQDRYDVLFARNVRDEGPCPAVSVFGPNMAVRAARLTPTTRYDERIGPNGGRLFLMGSETEFLRRLEREGARAWHAPKARVEHLIRCEEMTSEAVVRRAYRHGAGFAQMLAGERQNRLLGAPLWMWRGCAAETMRLALAGLFGDEAARVRARYHRAWFSGAVAQAQRMDADHLAHD